jgi:hypothetical protein
MAAKAAPKSNADHYRAAARHLERAAATLKAAHAELTPDGDELPFAGIVAETTDTVLHTAKRLAEYAVGGY